MSDLITTAFEVVGMLLLAAAAGVYLARFDTALGLAGAAAVLIGESVVVAIITGRAPAIDDSGEGGA